MSVWRHKALEIMPRFKREIEDNDIYTAFMLLLSETQEAHDNDNKLQLRKYYDYAEWCFRQNDKNLWNAAGVVFYEHLLDHSKTLKEFAKWVKKDIYIKIRPLLEKRYNSQLVNQIDRQYTIF
ncbi:hypothetical protein DVR12_11235 [Chitinophaga silvatica]|uniref:DUF7674 domain-containing protein n=1 Tax=Chitinophaga silvatica TaxID=2282649 RepID=A0A3E1Y9K1_9BACT|nr:hypothetical protein [Chitinophaga silvatica]RFS22380.1 hypothetical protein DVR12_11235 [Chitinophaga silvatica]